VIAARRFRSSHTDRNGSAQNSGLDIIHVKLLMVAAILSGIGRLDQQPQNRGSGGLVAADL
jgi:hypothetical protein